MEQIVLILKGWNLVLKFYKIVYYRLVLSKICLVCSVPKSGLI